MKNYLLYSSILYMLIFIACSNQKKTGESLIDQKVDSVLSSMTLEEKVGQMTEITLDVLLKQDTLSGKGVLDTEKLNIAFHKYKIGSVLNRSDKGDPYTREEWNNLINTLQQASIKSSGIPIIYGIDAIHGTNYTLGTTLFPQQIGLGATFNPDLVKALNEMCAYETRASGIPWAYSPVMDMGRDPRDARFWETFGEDPYLNSLLSAAAVKGFQGDSNIIDKYHVAACMKHFILYNSNSGKDRTPLTMSTRELLEKYVPDFQAAIDAGAKTVMISSGIVNGIPVHSSKSLLTTLLREEMGFEGFSVTDWADIENLHLRDKVAKTQKEAVLMAVNAGIDMSMVPFNFKFADYLIELVKEGKISNKRIDESVRRILKVKFELGLFNRPVTYAKDYPKFHSDEYQELALNGARESITLLENKNNILPLKKDIKVLVAGPNANSMRPMNGGWSYTWQGEKTDLYTHNYHTFLAAISHKIGKENVIYEPGVTYNMKANYYVENTPNIEAAVKAAKNVDYILLFLGENSYTETPGDLVDLYISENQTKLALELAKTGKPIILVLNEGRPRIISKFADKMQAILHTYLPGNYGGDALADILFGDINPSGKLPFTYPKYPNALTKYDYKPSENIAAGQNNLIAIDEQFSFGSGLSYTSFDYTDFKLSKTNFSGKDKIQVQVTVKNTGKRKGKEVVMLFSSDVYASITPDNKRLIRFKKIELAPDESKKVEFTISAKDLSFINRENARVAEKGDFILSINGQSDTIHLTEDIQFTHQSKVRL